MSKFKIPDHILQIIKQHKLEGERYQTLPAVVRFQEKNHYCASYHKGRDVSGNIFILENGEIPPLEDIKEVLRSSVGTMYINNNFYTQVVGFRGIAKRNLHFMNRALKLLKKVKDSLKPNAPIEIKQSVDAFLSVPETALKEQSILKQNAETVNNLLDEAAKKCVLTMEMYDRLKSLQYNIGQAAFNQNYVQMQTYDDRKKVISYLLKAGKIVSALRLFLFHLRLHPATVSPKNQADYEIAAKKFLHHQELEEDEIEFQKCLKMTRNPR